MGRYLLSVVLPTRNRMDYLEPTLRTLVGFGDGRVEILVEDNSDSPSACRDLVKELDWPHVSLHHTHDARSQTANSEAAIARATGEYICFIGDDDCITRSLVELVAACADAGIEVINFRRSQFYWPDVVFKAHHYPALSIYTGPSALQRRGTSEALSACLRQGAADISGLPRIYHGVVSRRLLDRVRKASTAVFPGPSPDMAGAVSLSLATDAFYSCDLPVLVDGIGYHSAGGRGARGEHKARLEDVEQLPADVAEDWDQRVPRIWLGPTIWAQSCITALRSGSREILIDQVRWEQLYARILAFHPDCHREVVRVVDRRSYPKVLWATFSLVVWRGIRFVRNGLYVRLGAQGRGTVSQSCEDIQEAVARVDDAVAGRMSAALGEIEAIGSARQNA